MFRSHFVAGFHVEEREVRVDELFFWAQLFGFVTFGDGGGKIALPIIRHPERELSVEIHGVLREHGFQLGDGAVKFATAEIEHRVVVLFLQSHYVDANASGAVKEGEFNAPPRRQNLFSASSSFSSSSANGSKKFAEEDD